jgi:hypothetical protein
MNQDELSAQIAASMVGSIVAARGVPILTKDTDIDNILNFSDRMAAMHIARCDHRTQKAATAAVRRGGVANVVSIIGEPDAE